MKESTYAIDIQNATVRFNKASENIDNLKEYFVRLLKGKLMFEEFIALEDITLQIRPGESWALIGENGAGKSTLLKLMCGVIAPYRGSVSTNGSISPMIELSAGMDPDLTARENIFLNGTILGYSKELIRNRFDEIVSFANLSNFLDMPIKNYSSGMRARLGFAVATIVKPDILIVDEVLAVGDAAFQKKCKQRMAELTKSGTTLFFVSHSMPLVLEMCENALWLDHGKEVLRGESLNVVNAFLTKKGLEPISPTVSKQGK